MLSRISLLAAVSALAAPAAALALAIPGETQLSIVATPAYPAPLSRVHLEARGVLIDLSDVELVWSMDDKVIAQGVGKSAVDITSKSAGQTTTVTVEGVTADGQTLFGSALLRPAALDLIVDADSYVPPFYRGRALPTPGSRLLLHAIPQGTVKGADLMYTWKRNGDTLAALSGRGRSTAIVEAPFLFGTDSFTVEARSDDGSYSARASATVPSTEPQLSLYQNHPLYGIMYNASLSGSAFVRESEMTFTAVPYFAPVYSIKDAALRYSWTVNDRPIAETDDDGNEITLSGTNSTGRALVGLELTHATNFFIDTTSSWNIMLSSSPANDIFRTF